MKPVLRYHQLSIMHHLAKLVHYPDSRVKLVIAEIGVRDGETSARLLRDFPLIKMYLIDNWPNGLKHNLFFKIMKERTEFANDRITLYHQNSVEAAQNIPDGSLDLCFIDADHSYDGAKRDIETYYPKVRTGGYLGGHDFGNKHWPGVKKAVEEFGQPYLLDVGKTWWMEVQ